MRRIYGQKSRLTAPLAHRRKTKFPTVYMPLIAVKRDFPPYIRRYTSPNENF